MCAARAGVLHAGDSFGERALLANGIRTRTLVTTSETELLTLHKHDYDVTVKPHHADIAYSVESCRRALMKLPRERTTHGRRFSYRRTSAPNQKPLFAGRNTAGFRTGAHAPALTHTAHGR